MSKKQKPKKKGIKEDKVKPPQQMPPVASDPSDESFNFGGLPERSLKKNLGCG